MSRARLNQEIRRMRFLEIYQQRQEKKLTAEEAAKLLGINERTLRRWVNRYETEGYESVTDYRFQRAAHNAGPADEIMELSTLYEARYVGFTASHFYDKYRENHDGRRSYTWVKTCLQDAGLVKKAKKRGAHRRKRPRQPLPGMMLHQGRATDS